MTSFAHLFPHAKTLIGMLHLKGHSPTDVLARARREARMMEDAGFDAVIVENYFGSPDDMLRVLDTFVAHPIAPRIGINLLGNTANAFTLARLPDVDFIQIDSVAGHLPPRQDADFALWLSQNMRQVPSTVVLGGARFKYQPVLSTRTEEEDVRCAAIRAHAVVCTSEGTGIETKIDKIARFRTALPPDTPLVIGAGLTIHNLADQMQHAQAGIVGSWLKDGHIDSGDMNAEHVRAFGKAFAGLR